MASVERTAYPRFRRFMSARELYVFYTPAAEEIAWARENASSDQHLLGLVVQLKTFSRLGYIPALDEVPAQVVGHIRRGNCVITCWMSMLPVWTSAAPCPTLAWSLPRIPSATWLLPACSSWMPLIRRSGKSAELAGSCTLLAAAGCRAAVLTGQIVPDGPWCPRTSMYQARMRRAPAAGVTLGYVCTLHG
jgi:Domain of unknown function (DUF4158)